MHLWPHGVILRDITHGNTFYGAPSKFKRLHGHCTANGANSRAHVPLYGATPTNVNVNGWSVGRLHVTHQRNKKYSLPAIKLRGKPAITPGGVK